MFKVCVFDLVKVFSDDLSLHFHNQSEIKSEDNTIWGRLNKIKDTDFRMAPQILIMLYFNLQMQ